VLTGLEKVVDDQGPGLLAQVGSAEAARGDRFDKLQAFGLELIG
jgi:hypothetical protein